MRTNKTCELCGHEMEFSECGIGAIITEKQEIYLCHVESHSCYNKWKHEGIRPEGWKDE